MNFPAEILEDHIACFGKTGSGKTSTAKLIVEQIVPKGARVCVLDPQKSDWWGLTSSADGKHPGLPFTILGGPRGHVPLHDGAGGAIGRLVGSGALPLSIIDMADFKTGGIQRFFIAFAEAIWKHQRGVLYLVIEEAHEFAPKERFGIGDENQSIFWAKKLATGSRTKGIRLIVLSQRTQALHNAVISSCETMLAHRMTHPDDMKPVISWMKGQVPKEALPEITDSLGKLPKGTAWLCSGQLALHKRIELPRIATFDNTKTPTGKEGEIQVVTGRVDQAQLRDIIGDAVKEAEANDPKALKARIAELERRVEDGSPYDLESVNAARKDGWDEGYAEGFAKMRQSIKLHVPPQLEEIKAAVAKLEQKLDAMADDGLDQLRSRAVVRVQEHPGGDRVIEKIANPADVVDRPFRPGERDEPPRFPARRIQPGPLPGITNGVMIPKGELAVLIAVAQHNGCSREQLTVLTGYKRSSRDAYIQRLIGREYVEHRGGTIVPTDAGIQALGSSYQKLPTGRALQRYWLERLPEGERRVLEAALENYPKNVDRDEIDRSTGYKRSSRDAYIQRLKSRQLVTIMGRGEIRASDNLF